MSAQRQMFIQHIGEGRNGTHKGVYLTRVLLTPLTRWGQIYLHIFHRGDADPDVHDHPWDFITFPFQSYIEQDIWGKYHLVKAFRFHWRSAEHRHRVIGRAKGKGKIVTLLWHGQYRREWGFWPNRYWVHWRIYLGKEKKS